MIKVLNKFDMVDLFLEINEDGISPINNGFEVSLKNFDGNYRYGADSFRKIKSVYEDAENQLLDIFKSICDFVKMKNFYVGFYQETIYAKKANKLYLKLNNGKHLYTDEYRYIKNVLRDSFKGKIFSYILLEDKYLIIATDHMDISVTNNGNADEINSLRKLLSAKFDNINMLDWNYDNT